MFRDEDFNLVLAAQGVINFADVRHISEIHPGSVCINSHAGQGLDRTDVHQGSIGDCWLLSALSSIANSSYPFRDLIDDSRSHLGITVFNFPSCPVTVDHFVLVGHDGKMIGPQLSPDSEYWPILFEKAVIKWMASPFCYDEIKIFNQKRRFGKVFPFGPSYIDINGGFPRWLFMIVFGVRIDGTIIA